MLFQKADMPMYDEVADQSASEKSQLQVDGLKPSDFLFPMSPEQDEQILKCMKERQMQKRLQQEQLARARAEAANNKP